MHPLRSVVRARQTIDHHRETIFTKWAQHPRVRGLMENPGGGGVFWKIRRGICVVLSEIFTPIYTLFAILEEE